MSVVRGGGFRERSVYRMLRKPEGKKTTWKTEV
jgi:hypothetical protein